MTKEEKMNKCNEFFSKLELLLQDQYETLGSCNKDFSRYLVPIGTTDKVTYYGKPTKSFRVSDHWNWYSNINKCSNPNYVQCRSMDMPWARKRVEDGKPTKPRFGYQVAIVLEDGCYHVVYGECFNRKTKTWSWVDNDPKDIVNLVS